MTDVLSASLRFPTVVFTALGVLCLLLWFLSLVGVVDAVGEDTADGLVGDALEPLGLADVPVLVVASLVAIAGWLVSVVAQLYVLDSIDGAALVTAGIAVLLGASAVGCLAMWRLGPRLGRAFATAAAPRAAALVGRVAEIRSTTVTDDAGYADTTWPDGRGERVNVRTSRHGEIAPGTLHAGDHVLLVAFDPADNSYSVAELPPDLR